VLTTLTKLFAPVMPFLAETMYQNLVVQGTDPSASVHLEDFPSADESLIDKDLSADMEALLRVVSLGSAARNSVKIKVRQPLAELKVQPADDRDRRAVARFGDQVCEELNVKKVSLHESSQGPLLRFEVKPNMKSLGPKFGPRLKEVQTALAAADAAELAGKAQAGLPFELPCPGGPVQLEPADVVVQLKAPDGWAGVADRGTQVLVDARLSESLKQEGMARDVVRQVQDLRKKAGLEMEDRINLYLGTDSPALRQAIDAHRKYIADETLAVEWAFEPLAKNAPTANVKIDGQALMIQLRKA
jgi:isoleucyl-tRNA synthetase